MSGTATRQTNWKFIFITVGSIVIVGFVFLRFFWSPLQEHNKRLVLLEEEYSKQRGEFLTFLKEKKRLDRDRLLGLPRDLAKGINQYSHYFQKLLRECGFSGADVAPVADTRNPAAAGNPALAGAATAKKAGHMPLTFLVRAQGDWPGVAKLLEQFQRTPLLHRVKTLIVEQQQTEKDAPGKLVLNMTVEALVVNRNDQRPDNLWGLDPRLGLVDALLAMNGQPTGWFMVLRGQALLVPEMPERSYAVLARVNPFVGGPLTPETDYAEEERQDKERLAKTFLTLTLPSAQEAVLLAPTSADKSSSIKLAAAPGQDTFPIWDGKKGKIIRVDLRDVYFSVDNDLYRIKIGQNLGEAMKRPLSPTERKSLGVWEKK